MLHLSTCSDVTGVMTHKYNTRTKKDAVVSNEALAETEESITSAISCLKEEIINLKDIVIKRLQEITNLKDTVIRKLQEENKKLSKNALN